MADDRHGDSRLRSHCVAALAASAILGLATAADAQSKLPPPAAAPKVSQFVLYAERSVRIEDHVTVLGGDIGVHAFANPKFRQPQIIIRSHGTIEKEVWAPTVSLDPFVTTGGIVANQLTPSGPMQGFPAGHMPPLPLLAPPAAPGTPVTVAIGQTVTKGPAAYGDLSVQRNGTIKLEPGEYSFANVELDESSQLIADKGLVRIYVSGRLRVLTGAQIYPIDTKGKKTGAIYLQIAVHGSDDAANPFGPNCAEQKCAVSLAAGSQTTALLAAPRGTLWAGPKSVLTGSFAAFDIALQSGVQVRYQPRFRDEPVQQPGRQYLAGYVLPPSSLVAGVTRPVPHDAIIQLAISLPVRAPQDLRALAAAVSDPKHPKFREFLTQDKFNATYGGTEGAYMALQTWVSANGLTALPPSPDKLILRFSGPAAKIEHALNAYLVFRLRADGTEWVSVDREPALDLQPPILEISGLRTSFLPRSLVTTTGGNGTFRAADLRNAYLAGPGATCWAFSGAGQSVGIVTFDNFVQADVQAWEALQIPPPSFSNVSTVTMEGGNPSAKQSVEATLDVAMVQAMAPQAQVLVFQGDGGLTIQLDTVFKAMANYNPPLKVASSSIVFAKSLTVQWALIQMAVQGTTFFQASGDLGDVGDPQNNNQMDFQTLVGGTILTTNTLTPGNANPALPPLPVYPSSYYASETAWSQPASGNASGGGIMNGQNLGGSSYCSAFCNSVPPPDYQGGVDVSTNGGNHAYRMYPDVAMIATNLEVVINGQQVNLGGTSAAAPLWAGFMAVANEMGGLFPNALPTGFGFLNPTIYDFGLTFGLPGGDLYSGIFNDITSGSNANGFGPGFSAVPGYDLVTGWGTPKCGFIHAIADPHPLTPTTVLPLIRFTIGTGVDDLRSNKDFCNASGAKATVFLHGGASVDLILKDPSADIEWSTGPGAPIDRGLPNPGAALTMSNGITGVQLTKLPNPNGNGGALGVNCDPDNWDITSINVNLFNPLSPNQQVCQLNLVANNPLEDKTTGLIRLSDSPGDSGSGPSTPVYKAGGAGSGCPPP